MGFNGFAAADVLGENLALLLVKGLISARRISRMPDVKDWGREMDKLLKKVPHPRVEAVVAWYVSKLDDPYLPQCSCAETFRRKYEEVEAAMVKAREGSKTLSLPPLAEAAVARLTRDREWPAELGCRLGEVYVLGRKNLDAFLVKINDFAGSNPSSREGRFLSHLLELNLWPGFVEHSWLDWWYEHKVRGRTYVVSYQKLIFRPDSETFVTSFWGRWSHEWSGDFGAFDGLLSKTLNGGSVSCG